MPTAANRAAVSAAMRRYHASRTYVKRCTGCKKTPDEVPFYAGSCSYCKTCFRAMRRERAGLPVLRPKQTSECTLASLMVGRLS
jgi:hypothetical protein